MAKVLMIQGTMSNVGKSLIVAALCRIYAKRGIKVAPFKSQNMALNSFITKDGLEIGRAQAVQAQAANIEPSFLMNPILLKPVSNMGSQVIIKGKVHKTMEAFDYYREKKQFIPIVKECFEELSKQYELIIIEGAGSPAEINLNKDDFVNMGLAKLTNSPVLLVADIDKGGVFAQLYGTLELLKKDEKELIKGLIINKFRGNIDLLKPGIKQIEELTNKEVIGTINHIKVDIDDEDSLTSRFNKTKPGLIDVAIIKLKYISNFSDFSFLGAQEEISIRYVDNYRDLKDPDLIIIPGTKNTIEDLKFLRNSKLEDYIKTKAKENTLIFGICGGYQILGNSIEDTLFIESNEKIKIRGLELLNIATFFEREKITKQRKATINNIDGILKTCSNINVEGYEIHMGKTILKKDAKPFIKLEDNSDEGCYKDNIFGTYLHGIFDNKEFINSLIDYLCKEKNIDRKKSNLDLQEYQNIQYNILAEEVEKALDMKKIDSIIFN